VPKNTWTDDQLRAAIAASNSYAMTMRALGLHAGGGGHYNIQRRAKQLGLDTSHFIGASDDRRDPWSDDELRGAVAASNGYVAVLARLGLAPGGGLEAKVRRRIASLGLDTSHFIRKRGPRGRRRTRWTDDQLRSAVASAQSYSGAIRLLGLIPAGGNYDQVRRRMRELELDISHFTGQGWNVGGRFRPSPATALEELLVSDRWTGAHSLKKRLFREGLKQEACELCGWAERSPDGRIPVELDHINGDKNDNRIDNLRIVCPNCHSLQPTQRGPSKQSARESVVRGAGLEPASLSAEIFKTSSFTYFDNHARLLYNSGVRSGRSTRIGTLGVTLDGRDEHGPQRRWQVMAHPGDR
jgi:hypothetical protein